MLVQCVGWLSPPFQPKLSRPHHLPWCPTVIVNTHKTVTSVSLSLTQQPARIHRIGASSYDKWFSNFLEAGSPEIYCGMLYLQQPQAYVHKIHLIPSQRSSTLTSKKASSRVPLYQLVYAPAAPPLHVRRVEAAHTHLSSGQAYQNKNVNSCNGYTRRYIKAAVQ